MAHPRYDERDLLSRTASCMPAMMHSLKPTALAVAILKPDRKPEGPKSEEDFLWIKCSEKTTGTKIFAQCKLRMPTLQEDSVLKHGPKALDLETPMSEIVHQGDRLVVLEVVSKSELPSRLLFNRQPLKPTNYHQVSQNMKSDTSCTDAKEAPPTLSQLQSSVSSGPQDENYPPRSGPRFPAPPLPMPNLGDDRQANNHGLTRSSAPLSPPRYPHTGAPRSNSNVPTTPSNDTGERDTVSTSPATQPIPIQSIIPGPAAPSIGVVSSLPAPDAAFNTNMARTLAEAHSQKPKSNEDEATAFLRPQWNDLGPVHRIFEAGLAGQHHRAGSESKASIEEQSPERKDGQRTFQLHTLLEDAEPEVLEAGVQQGLILLRNLKSPLTARAPEHPDALQWIQQIDNLQSQAVPTKTIIGVVGNTGAGKSSVINALLDEQRLLPTSCMRACTAVVTELSYNYEQAPYRAEIEFITREDWRKELETLLHDLIDPNGAIYRQCSDEDSDAGVAYAKIKAVYPRKTKEEIANTSIETMLREVSSLLGSIIPVTEYEPARFYSRLQHYVDIKEKATGDKKKEKKKDQRESDREVWPLIRVVRIYVKSAALSTGAVLVDLPGVHDANEARAAVAQNYMKKCTGLWIVAPINRAVDDKAAKTLLGQSFKRQLKLDGSIASVTFICSKTDDIALLEASDSLDLGDELGHLWAKIDDLGKLIKASKKQLADLKESKGVYSELMDDAEEQIDVWDALRNELVNGKTVFAPKAKVSGKKRKAKTSRQPLKKRRAQSDSHSADDDLEDEDFGDDESSDGSESTEEIGEPLTEETVSHKISEFKANKKRARQERSELDSKIKALGIEIKTKQDEERTIEADIAAKCISGRNKYSRGAIQQDYAAGIKEIDEELAAEEDEENFNPEHDARDYEEVARSLKCFCVSSRAYQKLSGRLQKDPSVPGFRTIEETEMPQLQAHCKELTKAGRSANCRKFINNLSQLLNSLALWAQSDGTRENLSTEQREREAKLLSYNLKKLENGLDEVVASTCRDIGEQFGDNIFDKYETAVSKAIKEATDTVCKWGAPVNRDNRAAGGVHFSTYKAICRRDGVFTNAQGPHEWNAQLAEPMLKVLTAGWEKTFTRRTPIAIAGFVRNGAELLRSFHSDIDNRARKIGLGIAGLHALKQQLSVYENILKDVSKEAADTMNNRQKEINREFIPTIQTSMSYAYDGCREEHGTGCYARMKAIMHAYVDHNRHTMFQQSVDEVGKQLKKMLSDLEASMNDKTDKVFISMQRDYRSVLGGGTSAAHGEILPKSERLTRKEILNIVEGVEAQFRKIATSEAFEVEDKGQTPEEDNHRQGVPKEDLSLKLDAHVKPEPGKDDQPMADVPESRENTLHEALSHNQGNDKPAPLTEGNKEPITKRETPDALDAQLNGAQINSNNDPEFRSQDDK